MNDQGLAKVVAESRPRRHFVEPPKGYEIVEAQSPQSDDLQYNEMMGEWRKGDFINSGSKVVARKIRNVMECEPTPPEGYEIIREGATREGDLGYLDSWDPTIPGNDVHDLWASLKMWVARKSGPVPPPGCRLVEGDRILEGDYIWCSAISRWCKLMREVRRSSDDIKVARRFCEPRPGFEFVEGGPIRPTDLVWCGEWRVPTTEQMGRDASTQAAVIRRKS